MEMKLKLEKHIPAKQTCREVQKSESTMEKSGIQNQKKKVKRKLSQKKCNVCVCMCMHVCSRISENIE